MKVLMISRPTLFTVPGGDTVQIEQTAAALKKLGVEVDIKLADEEIEYQNYRLIHFFNIIRPNSISAHVKQSKLPYVISTIFVDYSEIEKEERGVMFKTLARLFGPDGTDYIKTLGRLILNGEKLIDNTYLLHGHKKSIESLLNKAAMLLPNSHHEFQRLKKRYNFDNEYIKVPNAISSDFIQRPSIAEKKQEVLCIGRIEFIKNQLNLIRALRNTDIPLKIIGKPAPNHQAYFEQCKKEATDNIEFLGQLDKTEIIKRLDQAKVHVLPSWFETTGLSTIEAAARACNIVITRKGDTEEYFKDFAFYCEPGSPDSIREAIVKALQAETNPELKDFVSQNYTWEEAAKKTLMAYNKVLK
ncbi:MAG: glycosyltransferase [Bacteroidetes bacterium]|nr:MAG: glycosyltransferase [Bacteroidota bacterium]MBL1143653.1 glycosyltransferase [Bacteroidota bacterium]NOG56455.1 glycosyltransferase family 4 protein [Bacteroidota bacterium]